MVLPRERGDDAASIARDVRAGQRRAEDVVKAALARLDRANPALNAAVDTFHEKAMQHARRVDAMVARGEAREARALPLAGVPVVIKDNICLGPSLSQHVTHGQPAEHDHLGYGGRTTCASAMLREYRSPYTATAAQKLIDAGAIIIAKANLDEFAMGSSSESSCFGPARNPHDLSRVPGGSSGGSAALVASNVVPVALGSDTGGSVRQPAAFCGLVGVKPTYGRVSRYGLVAYASSLDQIGPLATSVADAALMLEAICGKDEFDSTSADRPDTDFSRDMELAVRGLTLGVPRQARQLAHAGCAAAFERVLRSYQEMGARLVDVDMPMLDASVPAYYIVATAEASSNLARFDGIRYGHRASLDAGEDLLDLYCKSRSEGFGREVQRRILLGTHVLSSGYYDAYYNTALKVRRRIHDELGDVFAGKHATACHAILMPTTPGPAFKIGEKASDPLAMYLEDVYTVVVNLAGLPATSVPAGMVDEGGVQLPFGVQIIARAFEESMMLRIARMFERCSGS
jgi:aspartyl-tRNA(Asn)/glutamyl-tRNA(Gln) amidotransferase subunit A